VDGSAVKRGEAGQRAMALLFPEKVPAKNPTGAFEGSERWYRSHVYFPADFRPSPDNSWNWVVQWHNWPNGPCCSNLALYVDTRDGRDALTLRVMGGGDRAHPAEDNDIITGRNPAGHVDSFVGDPHLQRQHWYDSVVHVRWSADPTKGLVEWWLDGRLILSRATSTLYWYRDDNSATPGATAGPGQAYYMEGYYRPAVLPDGRPDTTTASVYFDDAQIGPTAASVSRP
jgi:Polysaccharide lyase